MGVDFLYCGICEECVLSEEIECCTICSNHLAASDYRGCCGFVCVDCAETFETKLCGCCFDDKLTKHLGISPKKQVKVVKKN